MRWCGLLVALAACGRIGFEPPVDAAGDGGPGDDDAPPDTQEAGYPGPFDELVVWYRMDDDPMDGAHDDSGQGRDAAASLGSGITLVAGRIGMAFDFPAMAYLRAPHDPAFVNGRFTIAFWVKPSIAEWAGVSLAVGSSNANSFELGTNPMGSFQICTAIIPTASMCSAAGAAVPIGTWTHVAVTFSGLLLSLYRDGVFLDSFAKSGIVYDTHDLLIGAEESGSMVDFFAEATFDDVRFYQRDLSASEIAGLAAP